MSAYFIAHYVVNNASLYAEYAQGASSTIGKFGGEVIVFDVASRTIEGATPGPQTVVIKFESTEQADAWYGSSEYQAVVGKRLEATNGFSVISQSMNVGA
ncbi:MAG: hypothetical protein ACI9CE_003890 [Flavobacterium sp.]|jgi:uncharacterized protein (DUF1330 family)